MAMCIDFQTKTLPVNRSTTRIETSSSESMNAKQSAVRCSKARILQINDRPEPLLVHLNQIQWSMVSKFFFHKGDPIGYTNLPWGPLNKHNHLSLQNVDGSIISKDY